MEDVIWDIDLSERPSFKDLSFISALERKKGPVNIKLCCSGISWIQSISISQALNFQPVQGKF
jgi:hypothetical protein